MLFPSTVRLRGCCSGRCRGTPVLRLRLSRPPPAPSHASSRAR